MTHPADPQSTSSSNRATFDRTASARAAVTVAGLPPYNLDAVYAAGQARATALRLAPYREAMAALPGFDLRHFDDLADLANALLFAQLTLVARANRVRQLPALATEGYTLRALLLACADVLVLRGRTAAEPVARLRDGAGYRDLAEDLGALVQILGEVSDAVGSTGLVTAAELARAAEITDAMSLEIAVDTEADLSHDTLVLERQKLGALLLRAQAQLRRAMAYLRFDEGDAASLVPPLYLSKPRGRRDEDEEGQAPMGEAPAAAPTAPSPDSPFES